MGVRYCFIVSWLDPKTKLIWKFQLFYYPSDCSIEMYDIKNQKIFLKRVGHPEIHLEHLYLGGSITLYSRQLEIEAYGDDFTRKHMEPLQETTLALIKPDAIKHMGKIIDAAYSNGFLVKQLRMCKLSLNQAQEFYKIHADKPFFGDLTELISSGPCVAMELVSEDAVKKWRLLLGPTSTKEAKLKAPSSIRAQFGTDDSRNACHGSDSTKTAEKEISFFFHDRTLGNCAVYNNCTLCLIKPHAVFAGVAGPIIDMIVRKFKVTAMELVTLTDPNAEDFYELYKGVCSDYHKLQAMAHELASGATIALEICDKDEHVNPVNAFREFCGPPDPQLARALRPQTIRALFGINKIKNAVHCTDLPEDGVQEAMFIFNHNFRPIEDARLYTNYNLR